jgi:hypothetical protein
MDQNSCTRFLRGVAQIAGSPASNFRGPDFDPRSDHMGFMMNKLILELVFSKYSSLPCQFSSNSLFLSFLLSPIWSIGHPRTALFHFSFLILRQSVGLLGWGIIPSQGRYLYKYRINTDKHPCLEWHSNTQSQRSKTVHTLDRVATVTGSHSTAPC